jgi:hypothetical protein
MTWTERPVIHELNTAVWLDDLSRGAGRRLTLPRQVVVATNSAPMPHDPSAADATIPPTGT